MALSWHKLNYPQKIYELIYPTDIDRFKEGFWFHQKYNCEWYLKQLNELVITMNASGHDVTLNVIQQALFVSYPGEPIEVIKLGTDATETFVKHLLIGLYLKFY